MPIQSVVRVGEYHDSITLMQAAQQLMRLPGVLDAAVVMGTEANKAILQTAGLWAPEIGAAHASDLVIVVRADTEEALHSALGKVETLLAPRSGAAVMEDVARRRSVRSAVLAQPQSNLALISVAGQYAAGEAWEALKCGLNVFLFSDNVSVEDEVALKKYALAHGLLLMGPGCGTAILNGVALGFANVLPRGPVGIVAAAGTGLQEVSCLLARLGMGVSQGIGTGGRDLQAQVGGLTMLQGLRFLQSDPQTRVIVLVSKPPSATVAQRVLDQVRKEAKPTIVCFLGQARPDAEEEGLLFASTLQEAAYLGFGAASEGDRLATRPLGREAQTLALEVLRRRKLLRSNQKYLRGLYSGGTLQAEALIVLRPLIGDVWSNAPLESRLKLTDSSRCTGHCTLDLGEEEFTVGRPHPMIDNGLRVRRLLQEGSDPQVAVLLMDVVLGYGAHPDPASELGPAIRRVQEEALAQGRELAVVASVTGTEGDPQKLGRQEAALQAAGAIVCSCNAAAAKLAGLIVSQ